MNDFFQLDSIAKSLPEDSIKLGHVVKNVDWSDEENIKVCFILEMGSA